ncbi:MAG: hypothetical protein R3F59_10160 [Myxococcota bacterium]
MPAAPRLEHRQATVRSVGIALAAVPVVLPLLSRGGLAPLVAAAAAALLVGAPAAVAEWRTPPAGQAPRPVLGAPVVPRIAAQAVAEVAGLLLVASALAGVARDDGVGSLLAAGAWVAALLLSPPPGLARRATAGRARRPRGGDGPGPVRWPRRGRCSTRTGTP